jgi:hypothetical protein
VDPLATPRLGKCFERSKNTEKTSTVPAMKTQVCQDIMKTSAGNKRKHSYFTVAEKNAIKEGAGLFGFGKWKQIKEEYSVILQNRTTVQIKDQYRTMVHRNEVFSEKTNNPKQLWTPAEKAAVRRGFFKHGRSAWSKIKDDSPCLLKDRTCLQIKDCVRTMFGSSADMDIPNVCRAESLATKYDSPLECIVVQGTSVLEDGNSAHPALQVSKDSLPEEQARLSVESLSATAPSSSRSKGIVLVNESEALPVVYEV